MSNLHKKIRFSLVKKFYVCFFVLILYGIYKNGIFPVHQGFYSMEHIFWLVSYPFVGYFTGFFFDLLFKNKSMYNNRFFGVLFSLFLPISTTLLEFFIACVLLFFCNSYFFQRKGAEFHFVVFGRILLFFYLLYAQHYFYSNLLEESQLFVYSFLDGILGHSVSGIFTSNAFLLLLSFLFFCFDYYYKKEIPLYSYGFYLLTLTFYAISIGDTSFILTHACFSMLLFSFIFLAPISIFSPYSKKRVFLYSFLIGVLTLPFSLYFGFYEGSFFAIFFANLCMLFLNLIQTSIIKHQMKK